MYFIYRLLTNLILILSPLIIIFRLIKKKEDKKRYKEKFCLFSKKRGRGIDLLNIKGNEVAVDFGCMWGALTIPLAKKVKKFSLEM